MSTKHPDVIKNPPSYLTAMSLAEIHLQRWELQAYCQACRVHLKANVATMIRIYGPDHIWWGQQPPCPVWDCAGKLRYSARALKGGSWKSMESPADPKFVAVWREKQKRADLGPR